MPGRQYTHCIDVSNFDGCTSWVCVLGYALGYGALGAAAGFGLAKAVAWLAPLLYAAFPGLTLGLIIAGAAYGIGEGICAKQLNGRLVCLEKDKCVIGIVADPPEEPAWIDFAHPLDNDYTFNLILLPHQAQDDFNNVSNDGFQGTEFVAAKSQITSHGLSYRGDNHLHCEIEGGRAAFSCSVWKGLAPFMAAATVLCAFTWVGCALLALLLIFAALSMFFDGHDPSAQDAAVDQASGHIGKGDWVVVIGDHVYDGGHSPSWNEIHPVKYLQKITPDPQYQLPTVNATVPYDKTSPFFKALEAFDTSQCAGLRASFDPSTIAQKKQPVNTWVDHPDVDGCNNEIIT